MRVGIVGVGRIGGNCARQAVRGGHEVVLSFSRSPERLEALAAELGPAASVAGPREAAGADAVILSVGWGVIPDALDAMGSLDGRVVVDTTNHYGRGGLVELDGTAAAHNAARMPGARYTKCFNTLTSAFQAQTAFREDARVVQWLCGDDAAAKELVSGLVWDCGYVAVDVGGTAECAVMEAPRRPGAVYGEEYRLPEARAVVEALAVGRPIPPTPSYDDA
jgi:8-hydroxy-5-deazaflavin:NADPH oxidoreductase